MTRYQCSDCGVVFSRLSSLRNHARTHDNIVDRILQEISEDEDEDDEQLGMSDDAQLQMRMN